MSTQEQNRFIELLKNLALSLFIFICFFALLEFSLRSIAKMKHKENFNIHWFQSAKLVGWFPPKPGTINQLGFHNGEVQPIKSKNTFRILVLGASAVYGEEPIESSWTRDLENLLNSQQSAKHFEVLNAGVSGGTSNEQLKVLRNTIELKPDLVINYDGFNDTYAAHYSPDGYVLRKPKYGSKARAEEIKRRIFSKSYTAVLFNRFFKNLKKKKSSQKLVQHPTTNDFKGVETSRQKDVNDNQSYAVKVLQIWGTDYEYRIDATKVLSDNLTSIYKKNLLEMHELLQRRKIPHLFILQPNLAYTAAVKPLPNNAIDILEKTTGVLKEDWIRASRFYYPIALEIMNDLKKQGALTFDFTDIYSGMEASAFTDSVHQANGKPKEMIAQKVKSILIENKLIPTAVELS